MDLWWQTLVIGIGTWIASNLPWMMTQIGVPNTAAPGVVPDSVKYAFAIGAFVLFSSILYYHSGKLTNILPRIWMNFEREKAANSGVFFRFLKRLFKTSPPCQKVMKQLGVVQFFSWFAFFTMWSFATPAITFAYFRLPQIQAQLNITMPAD